MVVAVIMLGAVVTTVGVVGVVVVGWGIGT
jgi:hypothetical protein